MLGLSTGLIYPNYTQEEDGGWLKVEFVSTQTGTSSIGLDDWTTTTPPSTVGSSGDIIEIDYKIYLDNSTGKWDPEGDNDNVNTYVTGMVFSLPALDIPTSQIVTVSTTLTTSSSNTNPDIQMAAWFESDDRPQAGAVFYIKDIVMRANRKVGSTDNFIAFFNSDFTGGGDDNSDEIVTAGNGTINKTTNQSPT